MARLDVKDEIIHLRSAGVDLGKRFLLACVRTPSTTHAGRWSLETERFGTTQAEIRRLLAWLVERRVEVVVMEATSDYWRSVYYLLQPHLNLMLVNPSHLKGIRGRKTDPSDAAFLARAGASGMVMGSFVPPRTVRELRDLTRRRTEVVRAGAEAQRLEKELEDTGFKLTSVLSNVVGVSGRAILEALVAGERDPERLADLTVRQARTKIPQLVEALDGDFTPHHAFMVRHYLDQIDHLNATVAMFDVRIAELLAAQERDLDLLDTIPGISRLAAEIVIAETGGDMTQFATAHHLASWIGVCPGQSESAGVNRSGRTRHGNTNLKRLLGVAAMAAVRNKDSYLAVFYRRVASRPGAKRALVAVMHKLAIAIWHVLHDQAPYRELGADYFTKRNPERAMRRMVKEANSLGLTLRFEPISAV